MIDQSWMSHDGNPQSHTPPGMPGAGAPNTMGDQKLAGSEDSPHPPDEEEADLWSGT